MTRPTVAWAPLCLTQRAQTGRCGTLVYLDASPSLDAALARVVQQVAK